MKRERNVFQARQRRKQIEELKDEADAARPPGCQCRFRHPRNLPVADPDFALAGTIKPGDQVTVEGYPARDGSPSMRVYRVTFPDGRELVGQRPDPTVVPGQD